MEDVKVLVSGAGSIGKRHLRNLRSVGVQKLSVCDPDEENRTEIAEELSIPDYVDLEEGLSNENPDIVFICSPSKLHIEQALIAAKAGAHLFIEKPLSNTLEGIDELTKEVQARGLICMVGCNMRFHHGPATVKKLLSEGIIGKIQEAEVYTGSYLPNWRPQQDYKQSYSADPVQGGAILDCIHEIDLALWYLGPATLTKADLEKATPIEIDVEGTADLHLDHQNGAKSSVHLSFMEPDYNRFCRITGSEGSVHWDINKKKVEVMDTDGSVIESHSEPEGYDMNQMFIDEITYFLECVQSQKNPDGNLEDAIRALSIALEAKSNS